MSAPSRPLTLLIAALGGEGGGVLTHWIVSAASSLGFPCGRSLPRQRRVLTWRQATVAA